MAFCGESRVGGGVALREHRERGPLTRLRCPSISLTSQVIDHKVELCAWQGAYDLVALSAGVVADLAIEQKMLQSKLATVVRMYPPASTQRGRRAGGRAEEEEARANTGPGTGRDVRCPSAGLAVRGEHSGSGMITRTRRSLWMA